MRILLSLCAVAIAGLGGIFAPASAQSTAGPYLAARSAATHNNFEQAARYFTQALARDHRNPVLMESALISQVAAGDIKPATAIATALVATGQNNQVAQMVLAADAVKRGAFDLLIDRPADVQGIGSLVDQLSAAWAQMGNGDVRDAFATFDDAAQDSNLRSFVLFHKALALALVGDFESAEAIFSDPDNGVIQTRRAVLARTQVLAQLGRGDEALRFLEQVLGAGADPETDQVIAALGNNEDVPFTYLRSAQDGFAEVYYSVAMALQSEANPEYTLLYAQIAKDLRPTDADIVLLVAELFEELDQFGPAIATYKEISPDSPAYYIAELGRADALRRSGKPEGAIEVLEQLARSHAQIATVHSSLGDAYRVVEDFDRAITAYDRALAVSAGDSAAWFLHYARGISHERVGAWPQAEADFRAALAINPNQPQVLNYLGYSLVEQQIKLAEALELIERAASASPDSGYIIDSLGWVLFRLGRYDDAVPHMERAAQLMAVDPVVNDHLGDVYWAVGRYREAEFQWARALSFVDEDDPTAEADPDRIRQKLAIGLDEVLAIEGAAPLKLAQETN